MSGEIYCITSPSGKQYIGQAVSIVHNKKWGTYGRWKNHIYKANKKKLYKGETENSGCCRILDCAIRKYGHENFKIEILLVCNIKFLNDYETKFISLYNTLSPNGYNLSGGGGSKIWSEESKKLMSIKMKKIGGHKQTEETCKKISKTIKELHGKTISERNKLKIGVTQARKNPEDNNLPTYIYGIYKKNVKIGYRVVYNTPLNKIKIFSSLKFSLEDKLKFAIDHLNSLTK